ncbi:MULTISPECIES: 2-C-methyl-D-erythritol 4-phosphate cytidylyltransferase [unclassified Microbacterium]|uniref:2-C-methyl-D-erythritol 4-phosphate cytidylyltransferase n=1 Tax=unclassified Microbacterium TaxID=2609290 RepID=UPI0021A303E3|nr:MULTISPECIES: 2-C-methyl-D-erythritol 4-phosphate cytidylyltransferase [unclassified Microbacterium]MCT1363098.1 2-C-methyl-D-erythritol 4-phosphate cytidylyltransferase [Microbacterium sp. p3-SID131]MCT1378468.1 2-C-methyl-D-erythritol 4-phosphate cytidylyltransferase [Microbacterium sp. p3-SID337]MDH5133036.1 2-C-methyl-D-erythritol 4-phosphate cytidylyltransferase [Microbacterium sp. RD10]MDH5136605.1 2-C-methyl-D-erythritol 4-phosphate cytidylyltransferase [Microbacterium sp. RD11]MDH51
MSILPVPHTAIIVVAAGSGTRLEAGAPKAFVGIDGRTILRHALDGVFAAAPMQVVVVAPSGYEGDAQTELLAAAGDRADLGRVVTGGATRQESVAAGLAALWGDITTVLVHDAARALTPPTVIDAVAAAVVGDAGAVPSLPVVDTLKRVADGLVVGAVDRAELAAAQTPQGFPRRLLEAAYAEATAQGAEYTDDAALFAAAGNAVRLVPGSERSFKITTPADLERARLLVATTPGAPSAAARPSAVVVDAPRVGIGTDVHAFGGDGALWLAGLEWPGEPALSGHSDGDAVAHAIVDALLGAAGLGDIGQHFGTAHPEYAGAHADVFLSRTGELLAEAGFAIGNVSVQFQGNRPRFSGRRGEAEAALSAALGGAPVTVTATTTDGLGFPGRGEGIAVTAVAVVIPRPERGLPAPAE